MHALFEPRRPRPLAAFAATLAAGCALLLPAGALASEDTIEIVRFGDVAGTARHAFNRALEGKMPGADPMPTDPLQQAFMRGAAAEFDEEEITRRIADVIERKLTLDEARQFRVFTQTPAGRSVARVFKENKTSEGLDAGFRALPPAHMAAANAFFGTPAAAKVLSALGSPELQQATHSYGEEIACRHMRKVRPDLLEKLVAAGKCKEGT